MRGIKNRGALLASVLALLQGAGLAHGQVSAILAAEARRIEQAQAAQEEIDAIVATTRSSFREHQDLLKEADGLRVYNRLLEKRIADQGRELEQLKASIEQVSVIERQMLPLMTRMIAGLSRFIELDVPFLLPERRARVTALERSLDRADVTAASQFRDVFEAWRIEVEDYGSRAETYRAPLLIEGGMREVDFLRIGRVALLYLTPDGKRAGVWDHRAREWVELDPRFNADVRLGIETVRSGSRALFSVPMPAPEAS